MMKSLRNTWTVHCLPDLHQVGQLAAEEAGVRQHAAGGGAVVGVGLRQIGRRQIAPQVAGAGRRSLDLRDQRDAASPQRAGEVARRCRRLRTGTNRRERRARPIVSEVDTLPRHNLVKDGAGGLGHRILACRRQLPAQCDEGVEPIQRAAAVDGLRSSGDSFSQGGGLAPDEERRTGVEQDDVSLRSIRRAREHRPCDLCVLLWLAALQILGGCECQPRSRGIESLGDDLVRIPPTPKWLTRFGPVVVSSSRPAVPVDDVGGTLNRVPSARWPALR